MRYILKIVVPTVPPYNHDAYGFADALVRESKGMPPAPRLIQFHDALTARFPCYSTGIYDMADEGEEPPVCPWGDLILMECFTGDVGVMNIAARNVEVIPFLLRRAGALALTVIDEQASKVHRPATFSVTLGNIQKNVDREAMIAKLVPLLKRTPHEVITLLETPNAVLKRRLDHVTAQRFAKTLDLVGCDCTIEKETSEMGVTVPISGPGVLAPPVVVSYSERDEFDSSMPEEPQPSLLKVVWRRIYDKLFNRPLY
ncbi:MAG: hypothetical protein ACJ8GW_13485 [Massilia sp.]